MKVRISALSAALVLVACTTVQVTPMPPGIRLDHVCIERNPAVQVSDFVDVLQERLAYHGITSEVFSGPGAPACEFVLRYTALRSWDLATYLSHAELYLSRDGREIAKWVFHLRGKGGYALTKYAGTRSKINPVVDRLVGAAAP